MPRSALSRIAVERNRDIVQKQLGEIDRTRLAALPNLIQDGNNICLSDALTALFPGQARDTALTSYRQFRARVTSAAIQAGIKFDLKVDSETRTPPEQRWCWFIGDDRTIEAAASFTESQTRNVVRTGQTAVLGSKRTVRYFVWYAHADAGLKDRLLRELKYWFGSAKGYDPQGWQDTEIELGADWHAQIQAAIRTCDFGLLLVSPAFFASDYITRQELRHFISTDPLGLDSDRRAVPVALCSLRFDGTTDMKGLEKRQIFRDSGGKAFEERSTQKTRKDFVNQLFGKIVQVLDTHLGADPRQANIEPKRPVDERMRDQLARDLHGLNFVAPSGSVGTMNKIDNEAPEGERKDAVQFLLDWARETNGPSCCALLGSVGIGKTTTSKAFAHQLLRDRSSDSTLPMPIYLDLRDLGEAAKAEPDLKVILHTVLRRSWQAGETDLPLEADEVIRLVRHEEAIVIFDGLDEVLVHLSQQAGQHFTRELLRILPPNLWPGRRRSQEPGRPGRVMLTCRTHYFRSLREQQTHLTLEDRDDVRDSDYRLLVLLPFDDQQIRSYLAQTFPGREVGPILDTIHAVHNLSEMATRPYTLSLIARSLPLIEQWQMQGRRVTGVDLYRHMVQSWLERDSGKHEFDIDHKLQIMEYVAAELWRTAGRTWTARQMEDWLAGFLECTPAVAVHYRRKELDLLKKDLRTATFLVGGSRRPFRFAHSSLQEFFLAGYLLRALRENRPDDWVLPRPSRETFDFLGQMMLGEVDNVALAGLEAMRGAYRPQASEWAFAYILHATGYGYPAPSIAGIVLDGADLRDWTIDAPANGPLLALKGAQFRGAQLGNAIFRHIDLDDADFTDARALALEVNGGRAVGARFEGAALPGAVFRDLDLSRSGWSSAHLHRTRFLACKLDAITGLHATVPSAFFALCEPPDQNSDPARKIARLAVLGGHTSSVSSCAFSPDGTQLLSGSLDNTLKLWDTASGTCLRTFEGHTGSVSSCAFAPDGTQLLSASADNTLKLWDTASGTCQRTLEGHTSYVSSCAFAPDGTQLLSGSLDDTLKLWDAASGTCLRTLEGHTGSVMSCAFAPDGTQLLSGSLDNTLKLWDTASGTCLRTLEGHTSGVSSCAFAPDGTQLLSGSYDNTLKLWDTASGTCLRTLEGHTSFVMSCAFAPDGTQLLSGSLDNTLKLWDTASGTCLRTFEGHTGSVSSCAFAPDGTQLLSASADNTLKLWETASGTCLRTLEGPTGSVSSCAFAPDGTQLLSGSWDNTLKLWDTASGTCLRTLEGHTSGVSSCAFAPDGTQLLSASADNTLKLWDTASGTCQRTLEGHTSYVSSCAFAPDGTQLLSGSLDDTLKLWDTASGICLRTFEGHTGSVSSCAFAPDGTQLLSASHDQTLKLWDTASGICLRTFEGHTGSVSSCAFAPDGTQLLSASHDKTLKLWDAASGTCLRTFEGHTNSVMSCAFAPDGTQLLSASHDKTLKLWDAASGTCLRTFEGHTNSVMSCAFAPDGTQLLSASWDNTLKLWDTASGEPVGFRVIFLGHGEYANLTANGDSVRHASPGAWRDLAWLVPDERGALETYPAETFGRLPALTS